MMLPVCADVCMLIGITERIAARPGGSANAIPGIVTHCERRDGRTLAGVETFVVYLDFQALQPLSHEDLARVASTLRPDDQESCVWTGQSVNDLRVCIDIAAADFSLAAVSAIRELGEAVLALGLAGEVSEVVACSDEGQFVVKGADIRGLDRRGGQTYCDWCMGSLSASSIAESERLALDNEFTWACDSCLAEGAHCRPPDGWEPDLSEWPFREVPPLPRH